MLGEETLAGHMLIFLGRNTSCQGKVIVTILVLGMRMMKNHLVEIMFVIQINFCS